MSSKILLASPYGFCAGVDRAIKIVEKTLAKYNPPIYVYHEIVHNQYIISLLREKGVIFVEDINEVPLNSILIFSAHGVSKATYKTARNRMLQVIDATCPLVTKIHIEVKKMRISGYEVIVIGHKDHPEVQGTIGQYNNGIHVINNVNDIQQLNINTTKLAYVTQTTLSVDKTHFLIKKLKSRFPEIKGPKKQDICYATQNRQNALKLIAPHCDIIIVIGSPNSSNANRLFELVKDLNIPTYMIDDIYQVNPNWFNKINIKYIGLTAGASVPEILIQSIINHIKKFVLLEGVCSLENIRENISFSLPKI